MADEVVVDLMGRACGLSYADVASARTLIRLKDTPRPQDAMDRAFLEGVLRARGERV